MLANDMYWVTRNAEQYMTKNTLLPQTLNYVWLFNTWMINCLINEWNSRTKFAKDFPLMWGEEWKQYNLLVHKSLVKFENVIHTKVTCIGCTLLHWNKLASQQCIQFTQSSTNHYWNIVSKLTFLANSDTLSLIWTFLCGFGFSSQFGCDL